MKYRLSMLAVSALILGGCQGNPGGLNDYEYNSLSPDRKAELKMEQETLNENRMMRIDEEVDSINRDNDKHHNH
jgi:PBP1b-binding outer membrane lipoprotein LpoB